MTRAFVIGLTVVALGTGAVMQAQSPRSADVQMKVAQQKAEVEGDLKGAIEEYKKVVATAGVSRAIAAEALTRMAECYRKMGDTESQKIYERIVRDFADQVAAVTVARAHLAPLAPSSSSALPAPRLLWTNPLTGRRGPDSVSPDGRFAAFTEGETGDLAVRDFASGVTRRLTNIGGWQVGYTDGASISPDGKRVAYDVYLDKQNVIELRVALVATGESTAPEVALRTSQNDGAYEIGWLPDGKRLIVVRAALDHTSQIGIISIPDQSFRSIKSLEWRKPNRIAVSPDGRFVAYDVQQNEAGSPRDIFVLATDGSREVTAVQNPANDAFPVWSPDGSRLLFLSDRSGSNSLWAVPITDGRAAGAPVLLKSDVGLIRLLGMTGQSTLTYFDRPARPINLYSAEIDGMQISRGPKQSTERLVSRNFGATFSRDGQYLAYYSFRDTAFDLETPMLVIRSEATAAERTVPLPMRASGVFLAGPKWFPGNRTVLIEAADADGPGFSFYRVALDSGNTDLVGRVPSFAPAYDLSPDGKTLFYAYWATGASKLMRLDIETRRETELRSHASTDFTTAREAIALAVSPDGRQLGMTIIGGSVEIMPVEGGPSRTLFSPPQREIGTGTMRNALAWMPDQRFLLFVRGDGTFWKVPAAGGAAEPMNLTMRNIKSPTVHPDGKRLLFNAMGDAKPTGLWTIDGVLPSAAAKK